MRARRTLLLPLCTVAFSAGGCLTFEMEPEDFMTPGQLGLWRMLPELQRAPSFWADAAISEFSLKAFHADGSISVFPGFGEVRDGYLIGDGFHYSLDLGASVRVDSIPIDSIVGVFVSPPVP